MKIQTVQKPGVNGPYDGYVDFELLTEFWYHTTRKTNTERRREQHKEKEKQVRWLSSVSLSSYQSSMAENTAREDIGFWCVCVAVFFAFSLSPLLFFLRSLPLLCSSSKTPWYPNTVTPRTNTLREIHAGRKETYTKEEKRKGRKAHEMRKPETPSRSPKKKVVLRCEEIQAERR